MPSAAVPYQNSSDFGSGSAGGDGGAEQQGEQGEQADQGMGGPAGEDRRMIPAPRRLRFSTDARQRRAGNFRGPGHRITLRGSGCSSGGAWL